MPKRRSDAGEPSAKKSKEQSPEKFQALINAIQYDFAFRNFENGKFALAKFGFSNYIKQVLGKPEIRKPYISIEAEKDNIVNALAHLAKIYCELQDYPAAAGILQYAIKFAEKYQLDDKKSIFLEQAASIEDRFLISMDIKPDSKIDSAKETKNYKQALDIFRKHIEQEVADIVDETDFNQNNINYAVRCFSVEDIYKESSSFFMNSANNGFIQKLIHQSIKQLGEPPCGYAFIGLGSLSGGKMTPYSDLESVILIQEDTEEVRKYFRNLATLLNIKLINLGETPINRIDTDLSKYEENSNNGNVTQSFFDELTKKGFGPDCHHPRGSKTPVGRKGYEYKKDYELIQTVEKLLEFQNEVWFKSDPTLVYSLWHTVLITGDQKLLNDYRKGLSVIDRSVTENRVLSLLVKDIEKFKLKVGIDENGKPYDIKKDLYRGVDILINLIADYYKIMPQEGEVMLTTWQLIDKMLENCKLSYEGAKHLKEAVSIASEIRLSQYMVYGCQKEDLKSAPFFINYLSEEQKAKIVQDGIYISSDTAITKHYYYIMLRLQTVLSDFLELKKVNPNAQLDLTNEVFFDDTNYTKAQVCLRLSEFDKAIEYFKKEKSLSENDIDFLFLKLHFYQLIGDKFNMDKTQNDITILSLIYDYNLSVLPKNDSQAIMKITSKHHDLKSVKCLIDIISQNRIANAKIFKQTFQDIIDVINNLNLQFSPQEEINRASLINQINKQLSSKPKLDYKKIITNCTELGKLYYDKRFFEQAELFIKFSLHVEENYYLSGKNLNMCDNFYRLSKVYFEMQKYEESEKYFMKILEFSSEYKYSHPVIESANELFKEFHLKHNSFVSGALEHYYSVKFEQFQLTQLKIFLPLLVKAIEYGTIEDTIKIISDYDSIIYLYAMFYGEQSGNNELYSTEACNILLEQVPGNWSSPLAIAIYSSKDDMVAFWVNIGLCTEDEVKKTYAHGNVPMLHVLSSEDSELNNDWDDSNELTHEVKTEVSETPLTGEVPH